MAAALAAVVTAATAIVLAAQLRKRERARALSDLHEHLTTGETAHARDTLGTLLYSKQYQRKVKRLDAISSYFRLIWAVQHARNVFDRYKLDWSLRVSPDTFLARSRFRRRWRTKQAREIANALTWNLREIEENLNRFHYEYSEHWAVEDDDAWQELLINSR
ncbi:hypothetical protein ACNUCX_06740 [Curtobacterium flaccumfaciens pv. flaccumfaciens]|uniref:hypothetical protein n=1 Tax=Curtobacterium flaccumfaciens TaxID=2035 RepID=UPI003AB32C37